MNAGRIGICEWCGLIDHHLVAGECAQCSARAGIAAHRDPVVDAANKHRDRTADAARVAHALSRRVH